MRKRASSEDEAVVQVRQRLPRVRRPAALEARDPWTAPRSLINFFEPRDGERTTVGDVAGDAKFYPQGAAKAFFTAHNCKDPKATALLLEELQSRWQQGLYPSSTISYQGRFFASGEALREAHPELPCLF